MLILEIKGCIECPFMRQGKIDGHNGKFGIPLTGTYFCCNHIEPGTIRNYSRVTKWVLSLIHSDNGPELFPGWCTLKRKEKQDEQ